MWEWLLNHFKGPQPINMVVQEACIIAQPAVAIWFSEYLMSQDGGLYDIEATILAP